MLVTVGSVLTVENPTPDLLRWCNRELVISNPEYTKKLRMGFWLGDTPPTLTLYELHAGKLILPFGLLKSLPAEVQKNALFLSEFKASTTIDFNCDVPLYDYQKAAVQAMIEAQYGILQSPAGSGKTQMGIALASRMGKRTLWLCHTLDLVNQSKERAERYMSKELIGMIAHGKVNIGSGITFATIQTMSRLDLQSLRDEWDCIITDEVHRVAASPTAVTQYQKVLNALRARHKYGLSATVHRADGMIKTTYALVGEVAYSVPREAVADKIMQVTINPINTHVELTRSMLNVDGTLNYTRLITELTENDTRNRLIVSYLDDRPSIILSTRLEHLKKLLQMLPPEKRQYAVMISGKMTSKKGREERANAIEDMRTGQKRYLFATYALCKEGLDVPCLEHLFMATPEKDYTTITQAIGRIARTSSNKENPICYDFVDDMPYTVNAYKTRLRHYRKAGAKLCAKPTA